MNNAQEDFIIEELQQHTNGKTLIIEAMKAELDAILLNPEGGLNKRLAAPMTGTQFKVLEAFFKMGLPTLPPCPQCTSNINVEFRYFNNRTKTRLVQPRFGCKVCFMPLYSPQKEQNQQQEQEEEEHVNKRKKLEFTLHQEELVVLAGAWGGLQMLLQRFWSTPRVIKVLETDKFIPCSSRRRKSESPSKLSPKRKRRSWEWKQVNNGGSIVENIIIDHQMPALIRYHHGEDMLWMESFNSIIAAERLGSSAAYTSNNTNPNIDDSDWYYDYYI